MYGLAAKEEAMRSAALWHHHENGVYSPTGSFGVRMTPPGRVFKAPKW